MSISSTISEKVIMLNPNYDPAFQPKGQTAEQIEEQRLAKERQYLYLSSEAASVHKALESVKDEVKYLEDFLRKGKHAQAIYALISELRTARATIQRLTDE